jgi:Zn-dependent protease
LPNLTQILPLIPGFILGLTLHEFSHALMADRLGDHTARRMGRLTLNPIAHLDLFGSLMLIFAGFGWAKPVPVNYSALRSPRRDMALIAVAGPVANVILAAVLAFVLRVLMPAGPNAPGLLPESVLLVFFQGIWINVILAVFNLIPVPPLDGSRIVAGLVPEHWNHGYEQFERIGPLLLLGLVLLASVTGVSVLSRIIMPVANPVFKLVMGAWLYL